MAFAFINLFCDVCNILDGSRTFSDSREISACEKALLNAEPFVARDWVIPDGWYVFEGQRIDCNSAAKPRMSIFPVLISEIKIASAACYPGISLVQGNDRLQLNDDRIVNYRFLRVYVRSDGRWKLLFIEWTPIVSETMAGSRVESYGWYQRWIYESSVSRSWSDWTRFTCLALGFGYNIDNLTEIVNGLNCRHHDSMCLFGRRSSRLGVVFEVCIVTPIAVSLISGCFISANL
jgi:hypothetical protein